jgi:hypothetical protein
VEGTEIAGVQVLRARQELKTVGVAAQLAVEGAQEGTRAVF